MKTETELLCVNIKEFEMNRFDDKLINGDTYFKVVNYR